MIAPLNTRHMLPSELHTVAERIIDVIETNITDDFILQLCRLFKTDIISLKETIKSESDIEHEKKLMRKDHERDKAFLALKQFLLACSKRKNSKVKDAAQYLLNIIKKNGGNIKILEDSEETIKLHTLFSDLKNSEAKKYLENLHGSDWVEELFESQLSFEKVYNETSIEVQKKLPVIFKAKLKLQKRLTTILECVEELEEIDKSDEIKNAIAQLNKIIFDETNYIENRLISNHKNNNK